MFKFLLFFSFVLLFNEGRVLQMRVFRKASSKKIYILNQQPTKLFNPQLPVFYSYNCLVPKGTTTEMSVESTIGTDFTTDVIDSESKISTGTTAEIESSVVTSTFTSEVSTETLLTSSTSTIETSTETTSASDTSTTSTIETSTETTSTSDTSTTSTTETSTETSTISVTSNTFTIEASESNLTSTSSTTLLSETITEIPLTSTTSSTTTTEGSETSTTPAIIVASTPRATSTATSTRLISLDEITSINIIEVNTTHSVPTIHEFGSGHDIDNEDFEGSTSSSSVLVTVTNFDTSEEPDETDNEMGSGDENYYSGPPVERTVNENDFLFVEIDETEHSTIFPENEKELSENKKRVVMVSTSGTILFETDASDKDKEGSYDFDYDNNIKITENSSKEALIENENRTFPIILSNTSGNSNEDNGDSKKSENNIDKNLTEKKNPISLLESDSSGKEINNNVDDNDDDDYDYELGSGGGYKTSDDRKVSTELDKIGFDVISPEILNENGGNAEEEYFLIVDGYNNLPIVPSDER